MTVREALGELVRRFHVRGIPEAPPDAALLVAHVLGIPRAHLPLVYSQELSPDQRSQLDELSARREKREPLQYILGRWPFLDLELHVAPGTLIPRHDTEDWLLDFFSFLKKREADHPFLFADIGTGTGAIGLSLALAFPQAQGWLCDLSPDALRIAQKNTQNQPSLQDRLGLINADLTSCFAAQSLELIISNPPYVPSNDIQTLMPEVRHFEPHLALDGGTSGLELIIRLFHEAERVLKPKGVLAFEHGHGQRTDIIKLIPDRLALCIAGNDASNLERYIVVEKTA